VSKALAIAGVTAVLRDPLNDGLVDQNINGVLGSSVTVSVLPPDRVVPRARTRPRRSTSSYPRSRSPASRRSTAENLGNEAIINLQRSD